VNQKTSIVKTAIGLFDSKGFEVTPTLLIAKGVHVTDATASQDFRNKTHYFPLPSKRRPAGVWNASTLWILLVSRPLEVSRTGSGCIL
jgi:hypothetical protein